MSNPVFTTKVDEFADTEIIISVCRVCGNGPEHW